MLSALLEIDHQGEVVGQEFMRGVIRSVERMTYTNVHKLLEGDAELRERYRPLVERFELMRELALILNRKRVQPRIHRFRSAGAADRVRPVWRHDRGHRARRATSPTA